MAVTCWRVREWFWMLRKLGKGLEKKRVAGLIFWKRKVEVFAVDGSGCGELSG